LQSHGSLAETPLRSLLESAQGERSTGTLVVRNGNGQSTSLYFLFGHLFHAQGEGRSGDDAVVSALNWAKGDFEFDAKESCRPMRRSRQESQSWSTPRSPHPNPAAPRPPSLSRPRSGPSRAQIRAQSQKTRGRSMLNRNERWKHRSRGVA